MAQGHSLRPFLGEAYCCASQSGLQFLFRGIYHETQKGVRQKGFQCAAGTAPKQEASATERDFIWICLIRKSRTAFTVSIQRLH